MKIMEIVAETDDELMMKFFEGESFTPDEIKKGVKEAINSIAVTLFFWVQLLKTWQLLSSMTS